MGSAFEVRVPASAPGAAQFATCALDLIDELETQLTVYRDDSEVSRLNATAADGPVAVEARLFGLLSRARALSEVTEGAFDATSGALSVAWGFLRGPKRVPSDSEVAEARDKSGWRHLRLDEGARTIAFDRSGLMINLGAIGKGYAVDRAVAQLAGPTSILSALVHGGRSSVYALGSPPGQFGGRWEIALRNPFDPDRPLGMLRLRNRGLATSGDTFQWFEGPDGRRYGHILDPRTGYPAPEGGPAGVTVLAPTAEQADALSTAFTLQGPEWTESFLATRPELAALFVFPGDRGPKVTAFGASPSDWIPAS